MKIFRALFHLYKTWVPLLIVTTGLCFLIYFCSQQVLRQSTYDPQIQIAEDGARELSLGTPAEMVVAPGTIDIEKSLATFTILYGVDGKPVQSSGLLNGKIPQIPSGVLNYASKTGENRLTWAPQPDIRLATVIVPFKSQSSDGFLVVARSLRETERRTVRIGIIVFLGWLGILTVAFIKIVFLEWLAFLLNK